MHLLESAPAHRARWRSGPGLCGEPPDVPGGQPARPSPQGESDHVIGCTVCGKMLDMSDVGDVLDHLHGQAIEEEPRKH